MYLINVICSSCGNLLSLPEEVKHVTCSGCLAPLYIKRTDTTIYSEALPLGKPSNLEIQSYVEHDMKESFARMDIDTNEEIYYKIKRLDDAWKIEQEQYIKDGELPANSEKTGPSMLGLIGFLLGIGIMIQGEGEGPLVFAILVIMISIVIFIGASANSKDYFVQKREYEKQRTQLESQLK